MKDGDKFYWIIRVCYSAAQVISQHTSFTRFGSTACFSALSFVRVCFLLLHRERERDGGARQTKHLRLVSAEPY